jgi:hypothetical protein
MRTKNLLIGTLVLGLAALSAVYFRQETPVAAPAKSPLIPHDTLKNLQSLSIKANNRTVTIALENDGSWVVKEKFGLPADVENRLQPLLLSLQKAENLGLLTSNPKRLEKLGLADSSLTLKGKEGNPLVLEIGKPTDDGAGSSARWQGEPQAIRTSFQGYLESDPTAWMDPVLWTVKAEDIKAFHFTFADGKVDFARSEKGKPFDGKEGSVLEELANNLAVLRIQDAVAKDDKDAVKAFAKTWSIQIELFDGAKLTATFAKLTGTTPNEMPKLFVRAQHSDAKQKTNLLGAKAEFQAPSWLAEQIPDSLADFKKKVEPPVAKPGENGPNAGPVINLGAPGTAPIPLGK